MEDGETLTLEKTTKENWVKKHGQKDQEFSGHTTTYAIDGVPKTQTQYDQYIAGICDEKRFRALTNVRYVCEQIKWDERRKLLLSLFGDISDADVIAADPALKPLSAILGKRSVEDHKVTLTKDRKAANLELKEIRPRIDEQQRTITQAEENTPEDSVGPTQGKPDLAKLRENLSAAQQRKAQVSSGGQVADLLVELRNMEAAGMQIENDLKRAANAGADEAAKVLRQAQYVLDGEIQRRDTLTSQKNICQTELIGIEGRLTELRAEFLKANASTFTFEDTLTCPVCKQELPEDQVAAARDQGLANFNQAKASLLERNRATGQDYAGKRKVLVEKIARKDEELASIAGSIVDLTRMRDEAKESIEPPVAIDPVSTNPEWIANLNAQTELKARIAAMREEGSGALASVDEQIEAIESDIAKAEAYAAALGSVQKARDRIVQLEAEEKRLAGEVDRMENELFLCEKFVRAKCDRLTDRINSNFDLTKWRLFETQINGAIAEVCEATIDGRGYSSALSNSERIRVGLDICETLGACYKFWPPVVVDNAESIHDMPVTTAQQIRLVVSAPDKKLRCVLDEPKAQGALIG